MRVVENVIFLFYKKVNALLDSHVYLKTHSCLFTFLMTQFLWVTEVH